MSIIEEKMMETEIMWLSRIERELERANNLKALSIRMGLKKEWRAVGSEKTKNQLSEFEATLEAIMKGCES